MDEEYDFRFAQHEDLIELRKLSEGIYDGWDYFCGIFYELLHFPSWYIFVAGCRNNSKLAAASAIHLTDGGRTVNFRFARVHIEHRHRRLIKLLNKWGLDQVKNNREYRAIRRRGVYPCEILRKSTRMFADRRAITGIDFNRYQINLKMARDNVKLAHGAKDEVVVADLTEFLRLASVSSEIANLFPYNVLCLDGDTYTLNEMGENDVAFLQQLDTCFLVSGNFLIKEMKINDEKKDQRMDMEEFHRRQEAEKLHDEDALEDNDCPALVTAIHWQRPMPFNCGLRGIQVFTSGQNAELLECHAHHVLHLATRIFSDDELIIITVGHLRNNVRCEMPFSKILDEGCNFLGTVFYLCVETSVIEEE